MFMSLLEIIHSLPEIIKIFISLNLVIFNFVRFLFYEDIYIWNQGLLRFMRSLDSIAV